MSLRKMIGRCLRLPALHFALIGTLLFAWQRNGDAPHAMRAAQLEEIYISEEKVRELREAFEDLAGRPPAADELQPLFREFIDEEILYREARARGLDRNDRSVRWRLVEKMRFLNDDETGDPERLYLEALEIGLDRDDAVLRRMLSEKMRLLIRLGAVPEGPGETALQEYFAAHADDYRRLGRTTLTQIFFSADKRGKSLAEDARATRSDLAASAPTLDAPMDRGDVSPFGQHFENSTERSLAKLFGPEFAAAAVRAPVGAWSEPIRSAYGLHLVWVHARTEGQLPALDEVRNQVRQRHLDEQRERAFEREQARLRARYDVRIEGVDAPRRASDYFEKKT